MKISFYSKLARNGIRVNRKLYLPYILSCTGMVMMFQIIHSIAGSDILKHMKSGSSLKTVLGFGQYIVAFFALIFLFYTNSFLVRRRYKEFGLYNVLGMDKRGISRVVFWESLYTALISVAAGGILGLALTGIMEKLLLKIIKMESVLSFSPDFGALKRTVIIFAAIFALITLKSLITVRRQNPLELLRSETVGEKPPRSNWVFAVLGTVLLLAAYCMAVTISNPMAALLTFVIAVIMVIIASYMLFMSGSVVLCKLLQKNKKYYYKKEHFVSVSSMKYRMKRNGAGLASICILSTMVMVIIASTSSLFFGTNDSIKSRYPRDNEINFHVPDVSCMDEAHLGQLKSAYEKVFDDNNVAPRDVLEYKYQVISGMDTGEKVVVKYDDLETLYNFDGLRDIYFISQDDYNEALGTQLSLADGEAYIYPFRCDYKNDSLRVDNLTFKIVGRLDKYVEIGDANASLVPGYMLVVKDYFQAAPLMDIEDDYGYDYLRNFYYYGYNLDTDDDTAIVIRRLQTDAIGDVAFINEAGNGYSYSSSCKAAEKDDFYGTYGGLFFIGIILSVIFVFAAAMIIYYKQVSEGYEDRKRFDIMQRVGMTKKDILRSIRSQVSTVFLAPLLGAVLHLCFAFPLIWKLLQLFNLRNLNVVIYATLAAVALFALVYMAIYGLTAKAYYKIVTEE